MNILNRSIQYLLKSYVKIQKNEIKSHKAFINSNEIDLKNNNKNLKQIIEWINKNTGDKNKLDSEIIKLHD